MSSYRHILFIIAICLLCCSCVPRGIRKAQCVVAQADSLWQTGQMYGVDEGDSATLAQAHETLGNYNLSPFTLNLSSSYAHSCYHYGRLLRAKDNPVEAMQVFIEATHSHTRDYHIIGRVYSNMGDLCHLAGDFPLSYNMFERSADMFLHNGDTIAYYYALNDMAFELAEQGKKDSCFLITHKISNLCEHDSILLSYCYISQAQACLVLHEYDSVIHYVHANQTMRDESAIALLLAQSFSYMGVRDSAVYYAELVLQEDPTLEERNNALYIITNDDNAKDKQSVLKTAAERADAQKLLSIRQGKLSQAVQLLEQDLNRKPDYRWLYAIIATTLCIGSAFYWKFRVHKRKMNTHMEQLVEKQADTILQSIRQHIDINNLNLTLHWKNYNSMKADADLYMGSIVSKLEEKKLNQVEIRFCILTMLDFSMPHIAKTIHYSYPSGIKTLKKRLSDKLGTTPPKLRDFLLHMASNP